MMTRKLFALLILMTLCVKTSFAADIENGKVLFQQCSICHNISPQGAAKIGPNLWGTINRPIANEENYSKRYSKALVGVEGTWSTVKLAEFITNPQAFAPGTIMGFAGFQSAKDRADIIAFLNTQSSSPIDLSADVTQKISAAQASAPVIKTPANIGKLFRAPGAQKTFTYCSSCHSERIVTQQGLTKSDWKELLEWMVDEQDMDEIAEPDYSLVIDYLSVNYGVDRPNFPKKK